jgi:membrane associated rhomboid family serine protease
MGLYDRDYTQEDYQPQAGFTSRMRFGLPGASTAVTWLLGINAAVYVVNALLPARPPVGLTPVDALFAVYPVSLLRMLQLWRLISYQFLHGDFWHIFFNMWALWLFGPALENTWGGRRFVGFYLSCGIAGGLFYTLLVAVGFLPALPMVGASGAILGVFAACAILYPQMRIVIFPILIPIPIRVGAIGGAALFLFYVLTKGPNAGGEAAHLAGMAAGAAYVFSEPWRTAMRLRYKAAQWQKHINARRKLQAELDRILEKVHQHGIHSLTSREKRILKRATKLEQTRTQF